MRFLVCCFVVWLSLSLATSAPAAEPATCPPDLSGHWVGCWSSDKNGHHGPLQANFTKISDGCYRVRFSGRFFKIVPFTYAVTLKVVGIQADGVVLNGSLVLGPVLGSFQTDAVASATNFHARFKSKGDYGQFVLSKAK